MSTELTDELGPVRGDRIEDVTNVNSGDRARGAAQLLVTGQREGDYRPPQPVFDTARNQPDYALVPRFIEETDSASMESLRARTPEPAHGIEGLGLHARLNGPALEIELVQALGEAARLVWIVREQAADAD
jgi:hypothetical protein